MVRIFLHAVRQITGVQQFIDNTVARADLYHVIRDSGGDAQHEGSFGLGNLIAHHAVIDIGAEYLYDGIRIDTIDMAILTVTDLGQALYAELAHGFTNSKNLRKSRHIQNIKNLRADIFQNQLTAQFLLCLQQYPQARRRDIGKIFCINGQILTGNGTEQFFFKCSCVDRTHTSLHLNEGITHFRDNAHNIPPDDSHHITSKLVQIPCFSLFVNGFCTSFEVLFDYFPVITALLTI